MQVLKKVLIFFGVSLISIVSILFILNKKVNSINLKSESNITSILILGKGGVGHTAPDLTDTIMLASINSLKKKTTLLSLPRDIWVESTRAKLNSSYYWGKKNNNDGFGLATETVNEIVGIKPQYVAVIDFSIFKDLVDAIGGIDVNVETAFVDEKYPIAGKEEDLCGGDKEYKCRYETLDIKAGLIHMDGELSLKYVRSRNAEGDEGTDLAREKRQQKVISAVKDKILSYEVILNPRILKSLYNIAISHIETDIEIQTFYALARDIFKTKDNIVFLSVPENILKVSQGEKRYDRQYVFVPASGSWEELKKWIREKI